jgi:uncharacterized membrane protein YfhO
MLFFSIPYAEDWRLHINGELTPIEKVHIGFIGIPVGEGIHQIELIYRLPGLTAGAIMTVLGVITYIVFIFLNRRRKLT